MANYTLADVKALREQTGAGMMDVKNALVEAEGNYDEALKIIRMKGLKSLSKREGREASAGLVVAQGADDFKTGVMVEVNSETDFVAKNEKFKTYVAEVAAQAVNTQAEDIEGFMAEKWALDPSMTVKEKLSSMISIIGENMNIRRFAKVSEENGIVVSYIHAGGKIGVLVDVETDVVNDAIKEMAKNVAMQAAALKPQYTTRAEVDADYISREKEILLAQIMNDPKESQKPQKVIDGMINGRINKELKEICLMDQTYVKAEDGKQTVSAYVAQVAKENNAKVAVKKFVRFETGEGMQKKEEDFAAEVAKQMNA